MIICLLLAISVLLIGIMFLLDRVNDYLDLIWRYILKYDNEERKVARFYKENILREKS